MAEINEQETQSVLNASTAKAERILGDPAQVEAILDQVKTQVANLPSAAAGALSNIPVLASMIKGYITQEYTNVSPKVVASVLGALLYLVKGKDLVPDSIPVLGLVDDVAVIALAMKLNEPEIEEFKQWQAGASNNDAP
ncbi:MAG: DUF1232 domain-containing protein, partial [Eggerthellaceae bacterium]|nr:DUF1232 domain-containing protein [Eggerthellaceae bacterium]